MSGESLRLIACPHVLSVEKGRIDVERPVGGSVLDLVRSIGWTPDGLSVRVYLDGELVKDAAWEWTVPTAGSSLVVRAVPMGGQGGQGKDALRIVAMIGIIVASIYTGGLVAPFLAPVLGVTTAAAGALATAAISIIGTLAVNALIPPTRPKLNDLSGLSNSSNTLSLTGTSNQLIPYGVVPRFYGRQRGFPSHAAHPYTEIVGNDQYLRCAFCFGHGPLALSDFKIGEATLDQFTGVDVEVRQGYPTDPPFTLYPAAITEEPLSVLVTNAGGSAIRTSQAGATELSIDVTFPEGLWTFHKEITVNTATVLLNVDYREQGTAPWLLVSGAPAVPASLTTALAGSQNDLVVTQVGAGSAAGNNFAVAYADLGDQDAETLLATPNGDAFAFTVGLRKVFGIYSTAAQIKAFLDGATFEVGGDVNFPGFGRTYRVAEFLTVALAPGNDGTGQVTVMAPTYLTGGVDFRPTMTVVGQQTAPLRAPLRWPVPTAGIYEVRVTRVTPDSTGDPNTDALVHDKVYWTALRTIKAHLRLMPVGMAGVALRIKATNQLNGAIDQFNAKAESILPDWDSTLRRWIPRITNNPASIFRDVHQGTANARPKADSRMDLATMQSFHERCTQHGFQFNANIDFRSTVQELARDVLAAGRATPGLRDGMVSVVEDIPQAIPAHVFTPRNSWGFKGTKVFAEYPHGLKMRFANADTLQQDERVVLADGYGSTGLDGIRRDAFGLPTSLPEATKFETMEAGIGVNQPDQIFKIGRYHLAVLALRTETYTLNADFEHLPCLRGDLVSVQHDVPLFGLITGRITALTTDSVGRTTTITLDQTLVMEAGVRYGVRMRLADGSQVQREVLTVPGEQSTFTLLSPV